MTHQLHSITSMQDQDAISILGAGSWGNTLAFLLGQKYQIILWDRDVSRVRRMNKTRRFKRPIKHKYPDNVSITNDLQVALSSKIVINAISLKGMAEVFGKIHLLPYHPEIVFVNAAKGIDSENLKTPSEIIKTFCPNNHFAVLSGPNLAKELINGKPMVTEVACDNSQVALYLQEKFTNPSLRVYTNADVKGVELCGALKNVIAIAAGASDALKLGESAKASLITRGLHEIGKFLDFYGCSKNTLLGPAGIGDLIATCSSPLSRNYRVGFALTEGRKLEDIVLKLGEVAEGVSTARAVYKICRENNIQLPIIEQIYKILEKQITAVEAVLSLMNRPVK